MKVLLISPNQLKGFRPSLPIGMKAIEAVLKKHGYNVKSIDLCFEVYPDKTLKSIIYSFEPDVVGFSIRNIDNQNFLDPCFLLSPIKRYIALCNKWKPNIITIVGGAAFTLMPDEMIQYLNADFGIVGPGEESIIPLLENISKGINIPNNIIKCECGKKNNVKNSIVSMEYFEVQNLSKYDKRYFEYDFNGPTFIKNAAYPIIGKRGCPYNCIYCANSLIAKTKCICRPAINVVDDIEKVINENEAKCFEFVDGAFNAPYHHALEICKEMKKRRIKFPWYCMFTPGNATEELIDLMAETGCQLAELGTESGSNRILKQLNKHFMSEHIVNAHMLLSERNIKVEHCLFIGSPGENKETLKESFELMDYLISQNDISINRAFFSLGYRLFKQTKIYKIAIKEKLINSKESLLVPKFYIEPKILNDNNILESIESAMKNHPHWFLWWGFSKIPLIEQIKNAQTFYTNLESELINRTL